MKKIISIFIFVLFVIGTQAQQDAMFTHYMFNTITVNPAYAGSRDALSFTGLHRSQWVGMEGAPTTQTFNIHSPIALYNSGLGLSIVNDKIGVTNNFSLYIDYSFTVKLKGETNLSLGMKGGFDKFADNLSSLNNAASDQIFSNDFESKLMPNFGAGLYLLNKKYYVGLSVPRLLHHELSSEPNSGLVSRVKGQQQHYFLIAGKVFDLSKKWIFKPTTLIKSTYGVPIEADLTATVLYDNRLWAGANFRSDDAFGFLLGANITEQLAIGYSYDFSYSNISYNRGSHEIMLRYDFIFKTKDNIHSPRYF